ncbi:optineurin isoform X1 [Conger conger]|uniref:optineurin isoform X1 n=1 Tax=Conger conger TaxID=82655 RepID=UPI002A5A65C0|nr:optineurin isoform X1 [Conger conger]
MASNPPMENGAIQGPSQQRSVEGDYLVETATLEDTLQQMNVLMKENKELKVALKETNNSMKDRFEGLAAWKDKQKEERDFLEGKLGEAKERVSVLTKRNEELKKKLQVLEKAEGAVEGESGHWSMQIEALKAQIVRLQAEKSDLVAMNSELQLKMRPSSPEGFIEICIAEGGVDVTKDFPNGPKDSCMTRSDLTVSRQDSEEYTVSQLLQSLRKETQKVEKLEVELLASRERVAELEFAAVKQGEAETQTSLPVGEMEGSTAAAQANGQTQQDAPQKEADTELENLKAQMSKLFRELQQAQAKLDDAEDMKKSLHDRCRSMEKDVAMLKAQLVEKLQVQTDNQRLKLQLENMIKMQQRKTGDERCGDMEKDLAMLRAQLVEKQQVQTENEHLKLQVASMQSMITTEQGKAEEDRCRDMEKDLAMLRAQLVERQQVQTENEQLKLQVESMQSVNKMEQKKADDERCRDMEKDLAMLRAQLVEKQQVQTENEQLKLQVESMQSVNKMEQRRADDERTNTAKVMEEYTKLNEDYNGLKQEMKTKETENEKLKLQVDRIQAMIRLEQKKAEDERTNMALVKEEYTKLYEDYNALKQEMKKKEPILSNEEVRELQATLDAAEKALATKQQKIDEMKQEFYKKDKELETISVFQAQAEVYSSDFYAERAAREKIHEEKEHLAGQLEYLKQQNRQLQDEMESMGRRNLNEMQKRHTSLGGAPGGGGPQLGGRGTENIPEHVCPKCNEMLPDLDSLQIHIMDCII